MDNCFTSRVICWLYVRNVLLYFSPWITTNVLKILFYKVDKTIVRTVAIMQVTTWVGSPCQIIYVTFEQCIYWGHSTTTWTKFYTILITYPPRVDNCGHFTWYLTYLPFVTWPGVDFLLTPPPSSCPRSYWMTPKGQQKQKAQKLGKYNSIVGRLSTRLPLPSKSY